MGSRCGRYGTRICRWFAQRVSAKLSDNGSTLAGVWQLNEDDQGYRDDLAFTYRRTGDSFAVDVTSVQLKVTRTQILAFPLGVGALDRRLHPGDARSNARRCPVRFRRLSRAL